MNIIQLNFINNSSDQNNSKVVIFQKNVLAPDQTDATAWRVFSTIPKGVVHPFVVPMNQMVSASDSFGNVMPQQNAVAGNRFNVVSSITGNELKLTSQPTSIPFAVEIYNELPVGAINTMVYADGYLLAQKRGIGPGQNAAFQFEPIIYLALSNENIQEGIFVNTASLGDTLTQISLLGIASADIVLAGGGSGPDAQPLFFIVQNAKYA